jgi:anthranilate synthase component 1
MLVDLGRNDLGKCSRFGSVEVEKYMSVERFSHVMHIGSTVRGTLRPDRDALDAVDAVLPAGTLSGAPKLRACEIINELEDNKRGIYGGAIGYLDFTGNLDTCIAIRIAFKKNGKVFVRSAPALWPTACPKTSIRNASTRPGRWFGRWSWRRRAWTHDTAHRQLRQLFLQPLPAGGGAGPADQGDPQ